jgi:hypothetical protein
MKSLFCSFIFSILFFSCRKESDNTEEFSESTYRVELTGKWKSPEFGVPAGVHFTAFTGMVHNQNGNLWEEGELASVGVENIAEIGSAAQALIEIDSVISKQNASGVISIPAPPPTGTSARTFYCNSNYPMVSFVSMIAPSPDWFVGVNGLSLYSNKKWVADTLIQLYVYDAGTEDGDVFGLSNPVTMPQQSIKLLTPATGSVLANGNSTLQPIATVRFIRQ